MNSNKDYKTHSALPEPEPEAPQLCLRQSEKISLMTTELTL